MVSWIDGWIDRWEKECKLAHLLLCSGLGKGSVLRSAPCRWGPQVMGASATSSWWSWPSCWAPRRSLAVAPSSLLSAALIHSYQCARYRRTVKTPGRASRFGVFCSSVSKPDGDIVGFFTLREPVRDGKTAHGNLSHFLKWRTVGTRAPVPSCSARGEARAAARPFINNWCAMTSGLLQHHAFDRRAKPCSPAPTQRDQPRSRFIY